MFKTLIAWLASLFASESTPTPGPRPPVSAAPHTGPRYVAHAEQDPPEEAQLGVLHLVQDGRGQYWLGVLRCPCGCGATIQLPMTPPARPRWRFSGSLQQPSLWPSVWRRTGCKSHFVLKLGAVWWC